MKGFEDIAKEEFQAFEGVRRSGVVNMMFAEVQDLAHIDGPTHTAIMRYYEKLCKKWPDVRNLAKR